MSLITDFVSGNQSTLSITTEKLKSENKSKKDKEKTVNASNGDSQELVSFSKFCFFMVLRIEPGSHMHTIQELCH